MPPLIHGFDPPERFVTGTVGPPGQRTFFLQARTGSRIVSLPGTEHTVRGYSGVALLAIDEAARVPSDLYLSVRPMLAVSGGSLMMLSTPYGRRGVFFEEWTNGTGWERYEVTAEQCAAMSKAFVESVKGE